MRFLIKKIKIFAINIRLLIITFCETIMPKKAIFNYIKTPCGQAKYIELEANKTFIGKLRLLWFTLIASMRDWNIKD